MVSSGVMGTVHAFMPHSSFSTHQHRGVLWSQPAWMAACAADLQTAMLCIAAYIVHRSSQQPTTTCWLTPTHTAGLWADSLSGMHTHRMLLAWQDGLVGGRCILRDSAENMHRHACTAGQRAASLVRSAAQGGGLDVGDRCVPSGGCRVAGVRDDSWVEVQRDDPVADCSAGAGGHNADRESLTCGEARWLSRVPVACLPAPHR